MTHGHAPNYRAPDVALTDPVARASNHFRNRVGIRELRQARTDGAITVAVDN